MTCGDAIRSMTDEEIAEFAITICANTLMKAGGDPEEIYSCRESAKETWLEWLKQDVIT